MRLNGETRIHHLKREDQENGHVEYWNAGCGESRTSGVDAGKERKLLPMHTAWFERNDVSSKRSRRKPATHLAQFLLSKNLCLRGAKSTLALKTVFIGSSISLFAKMNHASDRDMPTKIWRCYVIVVSICCVRNTRPVWASTQNVSRPVGTTPIFSVFWLGLIRCDCPGKRVAASSQDAILFFVFSLSYAPF